MNKIINGKRYDTESAKELGCANNTLDSRDYSWWQETLYQKRTGEFFLHGEGGPMSRYATRSTENTWGYGEMIMPLSEDKACEWVEKNLTADEYEAIFGSVDGDETKSTVTYSLTASTIEKIRKIAARESISFSEVVTRAIDNMKYKI